MTFAQCLQNYMNEYHIAGNELAARIGCSDTIISRYKNGKAVPETENGRLEALARAVSELAAEKSGKALKKADVLSELSACLTAPNIDFEQVTVNLNHLIDRLAINGNLLSRHLHFDASYLSRIRSGKRKPNKITEFCNGVASFIADNRATYGYADIADIIDCDEEALKTAEGCHAAVLNWLTHGTVRKTNSLQQFLQALGSFDLNAYLRAFALNAKSTDTVFSTEHLPVSADYFKLSGFMKAELDWLGAALAETPTDPLLFYSDMPMNEMAKDPTFPQKWMTGLALLAQKGFRLNIIHNIERSFSEMMLGLQSWIPLYMTGLVSPYYLKDYKNPYFLNFLRTSASAAVSGEAIAGHHSDGKYHFTRDTDEVAYLKKRGNHLLSKASSLMEIYREDEKEAFSKFLKKHYADDGVFQNVLSVPPLYTISEELLGKILERNGVNDEDKQIIFAYYAECKAVFQAHTEKNTVSDTIAALTEKEFSEYPQSLPLADVFYEKELMYTFEEYTEHIRLTKETEKQTAQYTAVLTEKLPFRNIRIRIKRGEYAIVSKNKTPVIHFVIKHPALRQAIEGLANPGS